MGTVKRFLAFCVLMSGLFIMAGCQPESFQAGSNSSWGVGKISQKAKITNISNSFESFAMQAQEMIVSPDSGASYLAGAIQLPEDFIGTAAISGNIRSVYCDVSGVQISWLDSRDEGVFTMTGLGSGSGAGEKVLQTLVNRLDASNLGLFDGDDIQLVSGASQAIPSASECGSETISIPVGAPVIVFAGLIPVEGQTQASRKFAYRVEQCPANQNGTIMSRVLVETHSDGRRVVTHTNGSNAVSIPASMAGESIEAAESSLGTSFSWSEYTRNCVQSPEIIALEMDATSTASSALEDGAYAAEISSVGSILAQELSNIECRSVQDSDEEETSHSSEQQTTSGINTCVTVGASEKQTASDVQNITDEFIEDKVITVSCGGSAEAGTSHSHLGGVGQMSYPVYSGQAVYKQGQLRRTTTNSETGAEITEVVDTGEPWLDSVNCYRTHTLTMGCVQILPNDHDPSNWSLVGGTGYEFSRTDRVNTVTSSDYPGEVGAAQISGWSLNSVDCRWRETREATSCPAGQVLKTAGSERRELRVTSQNGNYSVITDWTTTTSPVCENALPDECRTSVYFGSGVSGFVGPGGTTWNHYIECDGCTGEALGANSSYYNSGQTPSNHYFSFGNIEIGRSKTDSTITNVHANGDDYRVRVKARRNSSNSISFSHTAENLNDGAMSSVINHGTAYCPQNGVCGSADGGSYSSAPSGSSLCYGGSPSTVSTGANYTWSCSNSTTDYCSATNTSWSTGSWTTGSWGACSASCGGGTQTRSVTCEHSECTGSKPASSQSCNTQSCPTSGAWTVGSWSTCSASCGGGTQTRSVTCDYDSCTGSAPTTTQSCNTESCGVDGTCGSANGGEFNKNATPSTNLCSSGTASTVSGSTTEFTWTCNGSSGGSDASCSAYKMHFVCDQSVSVSQPRCRGTGHYGDYSYFVDRSTAGSNSACFSNCGEQLTQDAASDSSITEGCCVRQGNTSSNNCWTGSKAEAYNGDCDGCNGNARYCRYTRVTTGGTGGGGTGGGGSGGGGLGGDTDLLREY